MKLVTTPAAARRCAAAAPRPLVLVPTMGALHDGHVALIREAARLAGAGGTVAVSIFVNPAQFGPREDYAKYPRSGRLDLAACRRAGAGLVFAPSVRSMYADGHSTAVEESSLSLPLCGVSRPGHFRGVCTVVAKLFLIFLPEVAVFGEKDWQQLVIVRRMVRDLNFSVRVAGHPVVREPSGLAMSSRNRYLEAGERAAAPALYAALREAARETTAARVVRRARELIAAIPGARMDYVELVDAATLAPARNLGRPARLAAAVFFGRTRLIDNIAVRSRRAISPR